jgi:hypothetical protein
MILNGGLAESPPERTTADGEDSENWKRARSGTDAKNNGTGKQIRRRKSAQINRGDWRESGSVTCKADAGVKLRKRRMQHVVASGRLAGETAARRLGHLQYVSTIDGGSAIGKRGWTSSAIDPNVDFSIFLSSMFLCGYHFGNG